MLRVEIVIYPEFKLFEAVAPMTVFHYANKHLELTGKRPFYDVHLLSDEAGAIFSDTGTPLVAEPIFSKLSQAHTILLVGSHDILTAVGRHPKIIDWTAQIAPKTKRLAGLCSGAFFLASAGLLNGKNATTHWRMGEALQRLYPDIHVDADAIFIQQGNLWTSAGVSAATDLALAFVEDDLGSDLALNVARDLVVHLKRSGGQSQFSADLTAQSTSIPPVRIAQQWMLENLADKISIPQVADVAKMSLRSFNRLFLNETGVSPSEFLEGGRLEKARRLIADSDRPFKSIAFECGFQTTERMRHTFQKHLALTPAEYRKRIKQMKLEHTHS